MKVIKKIVKRILGFFFKDLFVHKLNYEIMNNSVLTGKNTIGDNTYIGYNCFITESKIGKYCSIANNVSIGIGEHKIYRVSTSSLFYSKPFETLTEKECIVGNDVWIGSNVVIKRGVKIGNGVIIGANSFVNKDVNDFEIVGGTPAKLIKMRFNEATIQIINESKWWDLDLMNAKEKIKELEKTGLFDYN